jgi:hypothetical protein
MGWVDERWVGLLRAGLGHFVASMNQLMLCVNLLNAKFPTTDQIQVFLDKIVKKIKL